MADNDNDPTTATPIGHTQPMPAAPERAPEPSRPSGWRPGQVAVVAILALLLGGAGSTLAWLAADSGDPEPTEAAVGSSTTSTSIEDDEGERGDSTSTSSTQPDEDESQGEQNRDDRNRNQGNNSGGQTVVGNGTFTGSYQSNNDQTTDDFTVDDDWTIRWEVEGGEVTIDVLDESGEVVESIQAQGEGEREIADGGTYRIDFRTDGSRYSVAVTDGP